MEKLKVAATQLNIDLGNVKSNMDKALDLINQAADKQVKVLVLPEFFTSGIAINSVIDEVHIRNRELRVIEQIREKAINHQMYISGSILNMIDDDIKNSMFLVSPTGDIHIHNKDIPTQFENAYYTTGDTNRNQHGFGLALCWEMLRTKTINEFHKDTSLVLAGSCWWSLPDKHRNSELDLYNNELNRNTPAYFAKCSGLPIVHSSLVGEIYSDRNLENNEQIKRTLIGTTQIVDENGRIIKIIEDKQHDGLIIEEIDLNKNLNKIQNEDFWLIEMRDEYLNAWEKQNPLGKLIYKERKALRT